MMVSIGDVVEWRYYYTCVVLDIRDGFVKIRPWCDRFIWVRPSAVKVIRRAVQP